MSKHNVQTRRQFLLAGGAAGAMTWAGGVLVFAQQITPIPECKEGGEVTPRQTEGPFFKPSSPLRSDLREPGMAGRPVELAGLVVTRACRPVAGALVDLWHADAQGNYDMRGFRCRGHQFTDAEGRYRFSTVMPALYSGRARHFHVKVQAPRQSVLTTQLYFPSEPLNQRDGLFNRALLMRVAEAGGALSARFDFVLDLR
jgi:protocatechuate 3,4-dioxygenase beta subunit